MVFHSSLSVLKTCGNKKEKKEKKKNRKVWAFSKDVESIALLYPRHLCRGVYSFRLSVHLLACLYITLFVCSLFRYICRNLSQSCIKVFKSS